MHFETLNSHRTSDITHFFNAVFSDAEGFEEGQLIADLVNQLCHQIDDSEVLCFAAIDQNVLRGVIFLTQLKVKSALSIYMLAPVGVSTNHQGKGIGQALIKFGLEQLRQRSVDVVVTYGDPSFYSKVGFSPLPESNIPAPLPLSMPEGWLGQQLTNQSMPIIDERPTCVEAFNNPVYW